MANNFSRDRFWIVWHDRQSVFGPEHGRYRIVAGTFQLKRNADRLARVIAKRCTARDCTHYAERYQRGSAYEAAEVAP